MIKFKRCKDNTIIPITQFIEAEFTKEGIM